MLLAVDIGNSSIDFGVFNEQDRLLMTSKISADKAKCADEYAIVLQGILSLHRVAKEEITGCMIASVVPSLTVQVSIAVQKLFGIRPLEVGPGIKTGLNIRIDSQAELGADIVANAAGALSLAKPPMILIDVGTATTFTAISAGGALEGVIIAPGVRVSLDALASQTAELPDVSISMPKRVIGKNSRDSMNSGVIQGQALMIDGFSRKIREELKAERIRIFATGGLAEIVLPLCSPEIEYIPDLTLEGLRILYHKNENLKNTNFK